MTRVRSTALSLFISGLLPWLLARSAAAHGPPPAALAVLVADGEGPALVRLNTGLARRVGQRFQFVCPAEWGANHGAPALALADGTALIASSAGLFRMDTQGSVGRHPDPQASGVFLDLVRSGPRIYALRAAPMRSELFEAGAERLELRFSDPHVWQSIAASDALLQLVRLDGAQIEQLLLAPDGSVTSAQRAAAPADTDYVFAGLSGSAPYVLVLGMNGYQLGRIDAGNFVAIARASSSIAGPAASELGLLVGVDGALQTLSADVLQPFVSTPYVNNLSVFRGSAYASTNAGLFSLAATGFGPAAFTFEQLDPPALGAQRAPDVRELCEAQWDDLRFDLFALDVVLEAADAGAGSVDAGTVAAGGDGAPSERADAGPARRHVEGCSTSPARDASGPSCAALLVALALCACARRRLNARPKMPPDRSAARCSAGTSRRSSALRT